MNNFSAVLRRFLLAAGLVLWAGASFALQLGEAQINSSIGQPLDVVIVLGSTDDETLDAVQLEVNSTQDLDIALESGETVTVARITSNQSIQTSSIGFDAVLQLPGVRLVRRYSVFLDSSSAGRALDPVRAGQSLWDLARPLTAISGVSMQQMMWALYRGNPNAFAAHSPDSLIAGAVLQIPDRRSIAAVPHSAAAELLAAALQGAANGSDGIEPVTLAVDQPAESSS